MSATQFDHLGANWLARDRPSDGASPAALHRISWTPIGAQSRGVMPSRVEAPPEEAQL